MSYLGPSLASAGTLSGARISPITAPQGLTNGSGYYYNATYLTSAPNPATPWPAGGTTGLAPNQNGVSANNQFQAYNPANYAGWAVYPVSVYNADLGNLDQ